MKISEVVATLQQHMEQFGDIDVRIWDDFHGDWDLGICMDVYGGERSHLPPFVGVG